MIKSTSEAIGTGVNRVVTGRARRSKPVSAIFPGGSFSTFGKPMGEMKVVKKTVWGLLGSYTRYVKEFVPYDEDDFIDNKVLNGGGGSGVLVPTPYPPVGPVDPYVVPPVQNLMDNGTTSTTANLLWSTYDDDPQNPTQGFVIYKNGTEIDNLPYQYLHMNGSTYINNDYKVEGLTPATQYTLGVMVFVLHNGVKTVSIIKEVVVTTGNQ